MAAPGLTPTSPLIRLVPVFVTVLPANTAKLAAVPNPTGPHHGTRLIHEHQGEGAQECGHNRPNS